MTDPTIALHKAKHLLAHVLVAAGARRWPESVRGESGETATGFYADFGLDGPPAAEELAALTDDMARVLGEAREFRELTLTPARAREAFRGQPWKLHQIDVLAELEPEIRCAALDDFVDPCDCALKALRELRAIHPEKFLLTAALPVVWSHRGRDTFFIRITGELFPAPAPCACCPPGTVAASRANDE